MHLKQVMWMWWYPMDFNSQGQGHFLQKLLKLYISPISNQILSLVCCEDMYWWTKQVILGPQQLYFVKKFPNNNFENQGQGHT